MKLKAASNMSVIFCLLKTPRLMHTESATLTQLAEGQFLEDGITWKKGIDQHVLSNDWLWGTVLPAPLKVQWYGLLLNAPPSKSCNQTVSTMLYAALSNRDTYHYRRITWNKGSSCVGNGLLHCLAEHLWCDDTPSRWWARCWSCTGARGMGWRRKQSWWQ